ncbi:unnamed protein product [Soboliphyme baturini]|uniref:MFS domain-containing protein n=1 Tax=Soboliphyme baturini TaxID=241478 RepID=A0A183IG99_9BILA|nr:unnamed protein product [Soboliphyme baturini]
MTFDDLLVRYLGGFGLYQRIQYLLVCVPIILTAMHALSWSFTAENVPHRCKYVGENDSSVYSDASLYIGNFTDTCSPSCCRPAAVNTTHSPASTEVVFESCVDGYKFNSTFQSAVIKWNLVCDRKWIRSFVQSMYYVGQFIGSYCLGTLSDKYGRKKIFFFAIMIQLACGVSMAFVSFWEVFALFRIGVGFAHSGIFMIAVVLGMELVAPKHRVLAGVGTGIFFSIGQIILGAIFGLFTSYEYLQLAIALPGVLFFSYWWFVPESARWLITKGRLEDAGKILTKVAKRNGHQLPSNWTEEIECELQKDTQENKKLTIRDLFSNRIAVSCVYYALAINPGFLGGGLSASFMIGGALEIVCMVMVLLLLNSVGRKALLMSGFLLCSLLLLTTLMVPSEYATIKMILVVTAKSLVAGVYAIIYIFSPELFPTMIRSTAMGCCSMVARFGAVSASYFSMWLADDYPIIVTLIYSAVAITAAMLIVLLPETSGKPLPETIEDARNMTRLYAETR